jgi:hypothetical protein
MRHIEVIDKIVTENIEPQALRTDREGRFPSEAIASTGSKAAKT